MTPSEVSCTPPKKIKIAIPQSDMIPKTYSIIKKIERSNEKIPIDKIIRAGKMEYPKRIVIKSVINLFKV